MVLPTGAAVDDVRYWKSSSMYLWLLGYEFTDAGTAFYALAWRFFLVSVGDWRDGVGESGGFGAGSEPTELSWALVTRPFACSLTLMCLT